MNRTSSAGREDRRVLVADIAAARSAMQLPPVDLKRAGINGLRRIWIKTVSAARAAGIIE